MAACVNPQSIMVGRTMVSLQAGCEFMGHDVRIGGRDTRFSAGKSEVNVMNPTAVVVEGTVQPNGTLEVTN
jgi:hypothetical protein